MITDAPENVVVSAWMIDEDDVTNETSYTAVFTADEQPAGSIVVGGDMSTDAAPVWDEETGTYTVQFTAAGLKSTSGAGENVMFVALVGVVNEGEDGPPAAMSGFWLATNVEGWALIPPSESQETPAFGFSLTGPSGETGFIHMFMPTGVKDMMSEFMGKDLEWEDLAVFNDDSQASLNLTEVDGGAYINVTVKFSTTVTTTATRVSTDVSSVTKEVTVQEQKSVSLASNKTEVSKGSKFRLYGWLKNGRSNQTVTVWRKRAGEDGFTKVATLTTTDDGYFSKQFTAGKTARFKVKYKKGSRTLLSSIQRVTVQ